MSPRGQSGSGRAKGSGGSGGQKRLGRGMTPGAAQGRQSAAGSGRPSSGTSGRRPPPTRIRPGARPTKSIPSGQRGQLGRGVSRDRKGVGGEQVEGRQAVRELLMAGRRKVQEIWIATDVDDAPILEDIRELATAGRVRVRDVGRARFAGQARCEVPQGVLALAAPLPEADLDELMAQAPSGKRRKAPFLVALDGVTDPGNLGAVLRSAECAGATGVVLPRHRAVHVTPAASKAAAGAIEHLPIALVGGLPAALARMRTANVLVVGLDSDATGSLYDLAAASIGAVCLVLGAEGRGLSRLVRERCDELVSIPLRGQLGSLNVSAAAALACFEIARRRTG